MTKHGEYSVQENTGGMPTEETPRQILFALCWRGEPGSLDKVRYAAHPL